jgi:putative membrane protein
MNTNIRNIARVIWVGIKEKQQPDGPLLSFSAINDQKLRAINMLLAFAVATKHHLRAEYGTSYRDLQGLLPEDFVPCKSESNLRTQYINHRQHIRTDKNDWVIQRDNSNASMSLPLEISYQLSLWINYVKEKELIDIPYQGQCSMALSNMIDCFGNLERILLTPIPVAYNIHLKQILTMYCCILPFTTVHDVRWLAIPLCGAVAFTLFGIEAIGNQIEDPFGMYPPVIIPMICWLFCFCPVYIPH